MARLAKLRFDVARKIIESAFMPLACTVHVHAASDRVHFRVSDASGTTVFVSEKMNAQHLCNSAYLSRVLIASRAEIEGIGQTLDSWEPPVVPKR
jgi:hypothetical protein